jgi:hypothetical protein
MAKRLEEMVTRFAGARSGPEATVRQAALDEAQRLVAAGKVVPLLLIPEPENPFDPDAIRCELALPAIGRVQVGYVKNSSGICGYCQKPFVRYPKVCSGCRHSDYLSRDGAATKISAALRACPEIQLVGYILEVTGGTEEKPTFGGNIRIELIYPEAPRR